MAFVVLVKNINTSIHPDQIINTMGNNNIPMGNNIKYYKIMKNKFIHYILNIVLLMIKIKKCVIFIMN